MLSTATSPGGDHGNHRRALGLAWSAPAHISRRRPPRTTIRSRPVRLVVGFAAGGPTDILARVMAPAPVAAAGTTGDRREQARAEAAIPRPKRSSMQRRTDTLSSWSRPRTPSTPRSIESCRSTSCATSSRWLGSRAFPTSWRCIHPCPRGPSRNSSIMRRPIPARSTSRRAASAAPIISPASCSRPIAGINIVHVPYRGNAAAYADLISGRVQLIFADIASSLRACEIGRAAGHRSHLASAVAVAAGRADGGRDRARLRGQRLVRIRGAEGHAARGRRQARTARSTKRSQIRRCSHAFASSRPSRWCSRPVNSRRSWRRKRSDGAQAVEASGVRGD